MQVVSGRRLEMQWMQVGICCCQETLLLTKTSGLRSTETSSALWLHGFNKKQDKVFGFDPTRENEPECALPLQQSTQTQKKL